MNIEPLNGVALICELFVLRIFHFCLDGVSHVFGNLGGIVSQCNGVVLRMFSVYIKLMHCIGFATIDA